MFYIVVKNTPYGKGSSAFVCEPIVNFFEDFEASDTHLSVEYHKLVP